MARVTVEDCVDKVSNRFDLVLYAAHRSRIMRAGAELLVPRDNDKNPIVALREIADKKIEGKTLRESLIESMQKHIDIDEPEQEVVEEGYRARRREPVAAISSKEEPVAEEQAEAPMSEEDLLKAMEALEASSGGRDGGSR